MIDLAKLFFPFDAKDIRWRVGSVTKDKTKGMALAYLDARAVMDRLDSVCGPGGWQATYPHAAQKTVCSIGIRVGDEWVWKSNGAGDSDIEAEKGALSDAFKRAAVLWGIGRYLYDLDSPWVELDEWKRIKKTEYKKLDGVLAGVKFRSPDPDVADASKAWVAKHKILLSQMMLEEDVLAWQAKYSDFLKRLHKSDESLYEDVMGAYGDTLHRCRQVAA